MGNGKMAKNEGFTDPAASSSRHPGYSHIVDILDECRDEEAARRRVPGRRRRQADIERALGLHEDWFSRMKRGETELSLDRVFRYLDVLELPPDRFFGRAFPPHGNPVRDLVDWLRARAGPRYAKLRSEYLGEIRLDEEEYRRLRSRFDAMDSLQKEDPLAAIKPLRTWAHEAKAADSRGLGHALTLLGVAYKGSLRPADAAACVLLTLDLATLTWSNLLRCDALICGGSLVGDEGDYRLAAEVLREAHLAAELAADRDARGRSLLVLGIFLARAGQAREALDLYRRAATLVRSDLWRFGALQSAGVAALQIGDAPTAMECLTRATKLTVPRLALGFASWLQGETAAALERFADAAQAYGEARSLLDLSHPADWVLVSIQHARVLLRLGRTDEAVKVLRDAAPVAEALPDSGPAGAAKTELLVAVSEGERALARLHRLASRLAGASPLAQATARSLGRPRD